MKTLAPLFAILAATASADVLVVDSTGGGEFLGIAAALAQATDGDVLLVRAGTYTAPVTIDGLSVDLMADAPGPVVLTRQLVLRNTGAGQPVTLSGLTFREGLRLRDCAGSVQVQGCIATQALPHGPDPALSYMQYGTCGIGLSTQVIEDCSRVSLTGCDFRGADGFTFLIDGTPGDHALLVSGSHVTLFDCSLQGGDGGAPGSFHLPVYGGAGGDGLRVRGAPSSVLTDRLTALGGVGWIDPNPTWNVSGCQGAPVRADPGSNVSVVTSPALAFDVQPLFRGGVPAQASVTGAAGALVALVSAETPGWRPLGKFAGTLLVGGTLRVSVLGSIPVGGTLQRTLLAPDPGTPEDTFSIHYQCVALTGGARYLSEPRRVIVLDPSL